MSTGSKKRSREADYSVEQKGKAPKKQTSGNEASTSRQQPKQKETKDDGNKVKNINCKIDRRKKTIWKFCYGRSWYPFQTRYKFLPPSIKSETSGHCVLIFKKFPKRCRTSRPNPIMM
ncbi:hypothetical protein ES319_A11G351400v1 [Gossypium barbadense]|uniref:Uncharacterized protein n=2 Tax=Gossypium TaxID=3633 RepID=A0A5J5TX09_GOSBA|nr:hypothetical protein ES319_A11G351400v1 [Gossypium barbadense]TYG96835.1 hypothetical protein ES288_A11G385000v1 [Gossypium darwinii]